MGKIFVMADILPSSTWSPIRTRKICPNLPWEKMCGDSSVTGVESLEEGQHMLMEESLGRRKMVIRFGNF